MYSKSPDIDQQFSNAGEVLSKLLGGITEEINYPKKLASSIQMTSSAEPFLTFYYPIKNLQVIKDIGLLKKSPMYATKLQQPSLSLKLSPRSGI